MQKPSTPVNEEARVSALHALNVLDTEPEQRFDRITRLAQRLFDVPIALVSLVDAERQWFKSRQGLDATETPRQISFCGHAVLGDEIFVVPDTRKDPRFHDNPLVTGEPGIRFYAGCPLAAPCGSAVGTLCLIDRRPRELGTDDLAALRDLAATVERELAAVELATVDELTGLANRRAFETVADHVLSLARRSHQATTLLFFDLDGFKAINDRLGHLAGDAALRDMACLLRESFRDSDVIARQGGDEFCVLLSGASVVELGRPLEALAARTRARNAMAEPAAQLAYSLGLAAFDPHRHASLADLLHEADERMYDDKHRHRGETAA